jgi:hypothetical protein
MKAGQIRRDLAQELAERAYRDLLIFLEIKHRPIVRP